MYYANTLSRTKFVLNMDNTCLAYFNFPYYTKEAGLSGMTLINKSIVWNKTVSPVKENKNLQINYGLASEALKINANKNVSTYPKIIKNWDIAPIVPLKEKGVIYLM